MTTGEDDDWVTTAMGDDWVVAELLLRLKEGHAVAPLKSASLLPPTRWGHRQPRSRMGPRCCDGVPRRKEVDSARNSPTTPLSWSGGGGAASPSGTADGFEDSSFQGNQLVGSSRSKGTTSNDPSCLDIKKSKKRKTFAELKDEESFLLKERIHLQKEIATLRATFEEQRARNDTLKRMKLDLNFLSGKDDNSTADDTDEATSGLHDRTEASKLNHPLSMPPKNDGPNCEHSSSNNCQSPRVFKDKGKSFLLPDLNAMPSEEDSGSEAFYGLS